MHTCQTDKLQNQNISLKYKIRNNQYKLRNNQ